MSSSVPVSAIDTGILLNAGTNEAEFLAFNIDNQGYGVNVAKVREVLSIEKVTHTPQSHPAIEGVVRVRDRVVPLINLARFLNNNHSAPNPNDTMLLLEFNKQLIAFRVHGVERIHRVSWKSTSPLPQLPGMDAPVTSVVTLDNKLVLLLDFESISVVLGVGTTQAGTLTKAQDRSHCPLVIVDDSRLVSKMLKDVLQESGYTSITSFSDGDDAWNYLLDIANNSTPEEVCGKVSGLITDIEMPRMDGFNLTKRVRENPVLKNLPVILHSSLVSKDNLRKGRQVQASAQVSKSCHDELTRTLAKLLDEFQGSHNASSSIC